MPDHSLLMRVLPRGMAPRRARKVVRDGLSTAGVGDQMSTPFEDWSPTEARLIALSGMGEAEGNEAA
jgi:hypothetical protein